MLFRISERRASARVGGLGRFRAATIIIAAVLLAALTPQAHGATLWADYMFLGGTFGLPSTRLDLFEAHVGTTVFRAVGIGAGTSLFRTIAANRETGLSVWAGLPLDVQLLLPIVEGEPEHWSSWLRAYGTFCPLGFSMNKAAGFGSGRWYGGGIEFDYAPEFLEIVVIGAEFGWRRVQNTFRGEDNSAWYWGIKVGLGDELYLSD